MAILLDVPLVPVEFFGPVFVPPFGVVAEVVPVVPVDVPDVPVFVPVLVPPFGVGAFVLEEVPFVPVEVPVDPATLLFLDGVLVVVVVPPVCAKRELADIM